WGGGGGGGGGAGGGERGAAAIAGEKPVTEPVHVVRHAPHRREASHHEKERQGGDLAVGQEGGGFGRKRAGRGRKAGEQGRSEDARQPHDGGERHLRQHEDPHDRERDRHRQGDILIGPARQ